MRALALAVCCAVASGCAKEDLADFSFIDGLRLLGVEAEPPEAAPGDTVTLTAWAVDTRGRAFDVTWSACLLPSDGVANPACTDGSGNGIVALGSGETLSIVVPAVDATTLGPPDATNGVYLPLVTHVRGSDDALDAIYRLRIATGSDPRNKNPAFVDINGLPNVTGAEPTHKGQIWALVADYTNDSAEKYQLPTATEKVVERLTTQWFATAGSFPNEPVGGTAVQKFTIDRALPPTGGTIDLWVVGHDERGGTTMTHRTLVME